MPEPQDQNFKDVLTEQFTHSIRAVAELTQSIHNLQTEVEDHASHILQSKSELLILKEKLATLTRLVQGEGLTDSITSAVVELQTKIKTFEEWKKDTRQETRDHKTTSTTVIVLIVSAISTIIATLVATFVPLLLKG
jgi:chromosome segregation ATPase